MTRRHESSFFSHDLVRIASKTECIRSGYLFTVLGHPSLGRPLTIRNAYGTSIPHLDPEDIARTPIVWLGADREQAIADAMERAIELSVEADALESQRTVKAPMLLETLLNGDRSDFSVVSKSLG